MAKDEHTLPLADALNALRNDLIAAQATKANNLQLSIEDIEIEWQTVVTKEASGEAKISILDIAKLIGLGGAEAKVAGKLASVGTQRIKMKIKAHDIDPETNVKTTTAVSSTATY